MLKVVRLAPKLRYLQAKTTLLHLEERAQPSFTATLPNLRQFAQVLASILLRLEQDYLRYLRRISSSAQPGLDCRPFSTPAIDDAAHCSGQSCGD